MTTFSFRADHIHDVFELMMLPEMRDVRRLTILPDPVFPDVEVELVSDMSEEALRRLIELMDDAHVIADTFRPCALEANPLQRGVDPDPLPRTPEF